MDASVKLAEFPVQTPERELTAALGIVEMSMGPMEAYEVPHGDSFAK